MLANKDYEVSRAVARHVASQLRIQPISDEDSEFRRIMTGDVPNAWLLAIASDLDTSVRLEVAHRPLAEARAALERCPDRQGVPSCIAAGESSEFVEYKVMQHRACAGPGSVPARPRGSGT
ncbi:hypothetical protein [Bradyrhizobium sp. JR3.5]